MELKTAQLKSIERGKKIEIKKQGALEIVAAIAEELGEVVTEVSLFEQIGNKINWERKADKEKLAREISQLLINIMSLASFYEIDIDQAFNKLLES